MQLDNNFFKKAWSYITLPIVPSGKQGEVNFFDGGFSTIASQQEIRKVMDKPEDIVGLGAGPALKYEVNARDNGIVGSKAKTGEVFALGARDKVGFAHLSNFKADEKLDIREAADQLALIAALQGALGGYQKSFTAKFNGDFDVIELRTPNHAQQKSPCITDVLDNQVRIYGVYDPAAENQKVEYSKLTSNGALASKLGFAKKRDGSFSKEVAGKEIVLREGDSVHFTDQPIKMTVVAQYAPDTDVFEMGGIAGLHLHADGKVGDANLGGHMLDFAGLKNAQAQVMKVEQIFVREADGTVREAYTQQHIAREIATRALGYAVLAKDRTVKLTKEAIDFAIRHLGSKAFEQAAITKEADALEAKVKLVTAKDFQADPRNPWTSFVRNDEKRDAKIAELIGQQDRSFAATVVAERQKAGLLVR